MNELFRPSLTIVGRSSLFRAALDHEGSHIVHHAIWKETKQGKDTSLMDTCTGSHPIRLSKAHLYRRISTALIDQINHSPQRMKFRACDFVTFMEWSSTFPVSSLDTNLARR